MCYFTQTTVASSVRCTAPRTRLGEPEMCANLDGATLARPPTRKWCHCRHPPDDEQHWHTDPTTSMACLNTDTTRAPKLDRLCMCVLGQQRPTDRLF